MSLKLPPINKIWLVLGVFLVIGFLALRFPIRGPSVIETYANIENDSLSSNLIPKEAWSMSDYESFYEQSIKEILEQVVGVGEVVVMVNLNSTEEKVYQTNVRTGNQITNERDSQGGNRTIEDQTKDEAVVTVSNGNGEMPVVVKTVKPTVRGVVVVAEGAENPKVKAWIYDVVQRSLDVPVHRISVVPKKVN